MALLDALICRGYLLDAGDGKLPLRDLESHDFPEEVDYGVNCIISSMSCPDVVDFLRLYGVRGFCVIPFPECLNSSGLMQLGVNACR